MNSALQSVGLTNHQTHTLQAVAPSPLEKKVDQVRATVLMAICTYMPIKSLFKPELKIDLGVFIKDQMLFQRLAVSLLAAEKPLLAEGVAKHFEGSELLGEIKGMFSKGADPYLPHLYQCLADALNNQKNESSLESAIEGRIFTLKNALIAQHNPQAIINCQRDFKLQPQKESAIKAEGASWIRDSIQMHLAALQVKTGDFQQRLTATAQQLIPFVEMVTKSYLQDLKIVPVDPVLQQRHPKGLNHHGVAAAGIMECCLHILGFEAQLVERTDLDPRVTLANLHSVVIVTGPDGSRYVVDSCYLQFYKDVCLEESQLPKAPVLVLKESEVESYVEKNLLEPWKANHALFLRSHLPTMLKLNQNNQLDTHQLAKAPSFEQMYRINPVDWVKTTLVRAWECRGYIPVNSYRVFNEIFTGYGGVAQRTHDLVKSMGIPPLMGRATVVEIENRMNAILNNPRRLRVNDSEAINLFSQFYSNGFKYCHFFDTDPRNSNLRLSYEINAYYRSVCKIVNPTSQSISVVYGCAGADCTSVLLATDATEIFFVDACAVSLKNLQSMLKELKKTNMEDLIKKGLISEYYLHRRRSLCGAASEFLGNGKHLMQDRELKLIFDLKMMDVDLNKVVITSFNEGIKIEFPWNSFEAPLKNRTLMLLTADITKPEKYPPILNEITRKGFDIFYMKGAYHTPLDYPKFLPFLAKSVNKGGWLMTTDMTHDMRYVEPQDCLRANDLSFIEQNSEENERLKKLLAHPTDGFFTLDTVARDSRERLERMTHANWHYWTLLNLRQKIDSIQ